LCESLHAMCDACAHSDPLDDRPIQGPVKIKGFDEHQWTIDVSRKAGSAHVTLTCTDPCAMPYDPWSGQLCCCEWAVSDDMFDIGMEDIPITIAHEDHAGWNYWHDDYEPGWLKAVPKCI